MSAATGAAAAAAPAGHQAWALVPALPAILAIALAVLSYLAVPARVQGEFHARTSALACLATLALIVAVWAGGAPQGELRLPGMLGHGLALSISPLGLSLAAVAAWLWLVAALFARGCLAGQRSPGRFHFCFLLCLSGTVGVFLSGSFFTLFVFFELVSLGAYPLVVHDESPESMSAGRLYLYMSIVGGLSLLLGTVYLESLAGATDFGRIALGGASLDGGWAVAMALMMGGFAVKAGLVPVHVWLPRAHPVAPAPASALLSGMMIKTGAFGIFQVLRTFPGSWPALAGSFLVPLALLTMLLGACLAALAGNVKRALAYSSISQIGYVLLGAAMAGVLGPGEAMAAGGFAMHVMAHASYKSTMFLLAGLIYQKTHDLDLDRLGPLGRRLPVTAAVFGLAVLGISGVPGFAGYGSKTLLHDALLILRGATAGLAGAAWGLAEALFTLTSAITVAYTAKLWYLLFVSRPSHAAGGARHAADRWQGVNEGTSDRVLAALAAAPMAALGLAPGLALRWLVEPALAGLGYSGYSLGHIADLRLWSRGPLLAAAVPLALGAALFWVFAKRGFRQASLAGGLSLEGSVIQPGLHILEVAIYAVASIDRLVDRAYTGAAAAGASLARLAVALDQAVDRSVDQTARTGAQLAQAMTSLDRGLDAGIAGSVKVSEGLARGIAAVDGGASASRSVGRSALSMPQGPRKEREQGHVWTLRNLNLASMVMAALIGGLLLVFLFWGGFGPPA
jgi:formate hydrogenlyase subunit 3/multisubunit Na+/H+ antiporter MnhD subunit